MWPRFRWGEGQAAQAWGLRRGALSAGGACQSKARLDEAQARCRCVAGGWLEVVDVAMYCIAVTRVLMGKKERVWTHGCTLNAGVDHLSKVMERQINLDATSMHGNMMEFESLRLCAYGKSTTGISSLSPCLVHLQFTYRMTAVVRCNELRRGVAVHGRSMPIGGLVNVDQDGRVRRGRRAYKARVESGARRGRIM